MYASLKTLFPFHFGPKLKSFAPKRVFRASASTFCFDAVKKKEHGRTVLLFELKKRNIQTFQTPVSMLTWETYQRRMRT